MPQPEWMRVAVVTLTLSLLPAPGWAGPQSMYFRHLSLEDGLSQNTVTSILQDARGFMWLGTESGLNRYDGLGVTRFNRDLAGAGGLNSDNVWALAEDRDQSIWIGTANGGVARWDHRTETFTTFRHEPGEPLSLSDDSVRTLLVDSSRMVWVGLSESGLDRLDPTTGMVTHYRHDPNDPASLSSDAVYALHQDRAGALWVGTERGLNRLNPAAGRFVRYPQRPSPAEPQDRVRVIYQDSEGALWVGTLGGGVSRLDPVTGRSVRFRHDPEDARSLSHDHVRAVFEDDAKRLWIGTANGLNLLDRNQGGFHRFYKEQRPESLNDNYIMSIYQDRGGLLWIGTRSGGANIWNPRSWSLGHYQAPWLHDTNVTAFASHGERLWVATFGSGLKELVNGTVTRALSTPELSDDRVMSLLYDEAGALWVGTMGSGLDRYDLASGRTVNFRHAPDRPGSLTADGIMSLFKDRAGTLWIGTFGGGVNRFDAATGTFTAVTEREGLSNLRATAMVQDMSGYLWIGTETGLNRLDPVSGEVVSHFHDRSDPGSLRSDTIYALHVDGAGGLWVGTSEGGLNYLADPSAERPVFESFTQQDGLPSNVIYGIRSDVLGNLWLSSNAGLARLDPRTREVKVFRKSHGLQGDEFHFGAHHRGDQGVLYFGGANGFNAITPELLDEDQRPPPVVLTGIQKMNRPAKAALPYALLETLDVAYDETVLTFEFAALDFTAPAQNRFAYRLEGFDSQWNQLEGGHRATYTNLDAGEYVFHVKAANSEGVWNETGVSLPVVVAPAPWHTPWAYAGYALLILTLGLAVVRQQIAKRRRETRYRSHLQHLAFIDQLTGIANRQLFTRRLHEAVGAASAQGMQIALLYVDLDDFKRINDTLGHRSGDEMLKQVAKRLLDVLARFERAYPGLATDIARLGGDEFVLLVQSVKARSISEHVARKIFDALKTPFRQDGRDLVVTPSIGISVYPGDGTTIEQLMKNADMAMYEAKNAGRNEYRFFAPEMSERAAEHLALEGALRQAVESDQLWVAYQPKVDLASMRVVGAEALVRWHHPTRGEMSPSDFIPVAEKSGLIRELDQWVVRHVASQLAAWLTAGSAVVPIAVNLSGREFGSEGLVAWLSQEIERAGVPPALVELEVTEGVLMYNHEVARAVLSRLRSLGFRASVDDFGTGYCSLGYLKNFPLSALKIDRSFVADLTDSAGDQAICAAIISMARGLNLKVIAEGVETAAQLEFLATRGCDQAQGFYLHHPVPAAAFEALLTAQVADSAVDTLPSLLRHPNVDGRPRL